MALDPVTPLTRCIRALRDVRSLAQGLSADVLLPGHPTNRRPLRYCLHRLKVLHALFSACSMLQDPATRCDLGEVLSFHDVGPKTPDEHEKFLIEFSDSFAGCRDGNSSS